MLLKSLKHIKSLTFHTNLNYKVPKHYILEIYIDVYTVNEQSKLDC